MLRLRPDDAAMPGTRAQLLTTGSALQELRQEWERLWAQDPRATPFQSPAWLLPWWRHVGAGSLASVAVRCEASGELVGLAPLYLHVDAATRRRHLFPVGIATTDYLDLLARPGREQQVVRAVFTQLADCGDAWDVLEFPQLRQDAPLLRAAVAAGYRAEITPGEPHPVLRLRAAGVPARLAIPKGMAANLRTCRNRADRAGTVRCEQADSGSIDELLAALALLHTARWSQRGLPGVLADAAVRGCHREAAPLLLAAGLLRLYGLRLAADLIAVLYCLADPPGRRERRCYYYLGGFDPRFAALGPGSLLIAHAIGQAMQEGAAAFDFLRGAEPYKYHWGASDQAMATLRLSPTPRAPALRVLHA
jgi:CelD/BcsL family acetyltransferase involved in cellulose biosynthesis